MADEADFNASGRLTTALTLGLHDIAGVSFAKSILADPTTGDPLDPSRNIIVPPDAVAVSATIATTGTLLEQNWGDFDAFLFRVTSISGGTINFKESMDGINFGDSYAEELGARHGKPPVYFTSISGRHFALNREGIKFQLNVSGSVSGNVTVDGYLISHRSRGTIFTAPTNSDGTNRSLDVTTTSQQLVAANPNRRELMLMNSSDTDITVGFSSSAITAGPGSGKMVLKAAMTAPIYLGTVKYNGAIQAIHAGTGSKNIFAWEL